MAAEKMAKGKNSRRKKRPKENMSDGKNGQRIKRPLPDCVFVLNT